MQTINKVIGQMVLAFPHQQVADYTTWVSGTRVKKHHKRKE
jgi:hypothetical protein